MKNYWLCGVVLFLLAFSPVTAQAPPPVGSGVGINYINVTQTGKVPQWQLAMNGFMTLGTGCTLNSWRIAFIDPNANYLAPYINFTPPTAGASTQFNAYLTVTTQGNWSGYVSMGYTDSNGDTMSLSTNQPFTVPAGQ